ADREGPLDLLDAPRPVEVPGVVTHRERASEPALVQHGAVGVYAGQEVPGPAAPERLVRDELLEEDLDQHRAAGLVRMGEGVEQQALRPVADAYHLDRPPLGGGADPLDRDQVGVGRGDAMGAVQHLGERVEAVVVRDARERGFQFCGHAHLPLPLGSKASRRPSPTKLKPRTTTIIAKPGQRMRFGARRMKSLPSAIIAPHSGVGGCTPSPRKPRAALARMASGMPKVAVTTTGVRTLGSTWRNITRQRLIPDARAASTYSTSWRASTCALTKRA